MMVAEYKTTKGRDYYNEGRRPKHPDPNTVARQRSRKEIKDSLSEIDSKLDLIHDLAWELYLAESELLDD